MAVRQNSGMDRPAVMQTSGSGWITGILVWIGGMDRPVGSGYGSGFYILTRSHMELSISTCLPIESWTLMSWLSNPVLLMRLPSAYLSRTQIWFTQGHLRTRLGLAYMKGIDMLYLLVIQYPLCNSFCNPYALQVWACSLFTHKFLALLNSLGGCLAIPLFWAFSFR